MGRYNAAPLFIPHTIFGVVECSVLQHLRYEALSNPFSSQTSTTKARSSYMVEISWMAQIWMLSSQNSSTSETSATVARGPPKVGDVGKCSATQQHTRCTQDQYQAHPDELSGSKRKMHTHNTTSGRIRPGIVVTKGYDDEGRRIIQDIYVSKQNNPAARLGAPLNHTTTRLHRQINSEKLAKASDNMSAKGSRDWSEK